MSIRSPQIRLAFGLAASCFIIGCREAPLPTGPGIRAFSKVANAAATHSHFVAGPFDFIGTLHLSCIDEDVILHNVGAVLTFDVVETSSGNTITRASITWPDHQFYVERQNGVRYYQPANAKSTYHEFAGPVHFVTITDAWNLRAADGSMLKFQAHTRIEFNDAGDVVDVKVTGACP